MFIQIHVNHFNSHVQNHHSTPKLQTISPTLHKPFIIYSIIHYKHFHYNSNLQTHIRFLFPFTCFNLNLNQVQLSNIIKHFQYIAFQPCFNYNTLIPITTSIQWPQSLQNFKRPSFSKLGISQVPLNYVVIFQISSKITTNIQPCFT